MADRPFYTLEAEPKYSDNVQKLLNDDPVLAENSVLEQLILKILNNTKAVKLLADALEENKADLSDLNRPGAHGIAGYDWTLEELKARARVINGKISPMPTAADVGLGSVDNTRDADKRVSYAASAGSAASAGAAPWSGISGKPGNYPPSAHTHDDRYYTEGEVSNLLNGRIPTSASCNKNWNWSGQGGQPQWLWGGNDAANMYVYNPSNFNVNYANSAGSVAWGNVSGRPSSMPANGGTSAACSGNAATATTASNANACNGLTFAISGAAPGVVNNRVTFVYG